MGNKITRQVLDIEGMTCSGCEMRIERKLRKLSGIMSARAEYGVSKVYVTYDESEISLDAIIKAIEALDYGAALETASRPQKSKEKQALKGGDGRSSINQLIGMGIILFAIYMIIKNTVGFNFIPEVNQQMGYGILFVVGMITSVHCIAMCGGINLSQCVSYKFDQGEQGKLAKMKPSLMYNAGRVISYTVIGGIVGALGSVISFSGTSKGVVAIISGVFMVIMGINMLNIFPWLRKLNPRMPKIFGNKIQASQGKHGPFYVGLANGLMPCGPLQAMQIYALGSGSALAGAMSMFMFSLGTVPLMFGFGAISSFLSSKSTHTMMKVSAILVTVLGVIMVNRGLSLSGIDVAYAFGAPSTGSVAKVEGNVQVVTTKIESGSYTPIVVQKGIPVKWIIQATADTLNGCNNTIVIAKFNLQKKLVAGDNVVEFTPDETGNIPYSCWMGMIRSNIRVVADVNNLSAADVAQTSQSAVGGVGGGCCSSGALAGKFAGGKVPTDKIQVATIKNKQQVITVKVNDQGYDPAVFVVQKGVPTVVKFVAEKLNSCNYVVSFPDLQGQLDLSAGQLETPPLTPEKDFTFQCSMGMLHGYVKVVDDLKTVNLDQVRQEVGKFTATGGGGCCGGGSSSGTSNGGVSSAPLSTGSGSNGSV